MRVLRVMADLRVADVEAAKSFYTDYLGLSTEEFNTGLNAKSFSLFRIGSGSVQERSGIG